MSLYADSNYSYNPWMRDVLPQMQPDNEAVAVLEQEEMIDALLANSPLPPPAYDIPRFGYRNGEPTIFDVLGQPPPLLSKSEAGPQGSARNVQGMW